MYKHVTNDHAGEEDLVDFEMAMTSSFKKPISRIINEGVRIKNKPKNTILNSKSEHFGPSIKRKTIDNEPKNCDECDSKHHSKWKLEKHKEEEHSRKINNCQQCDSKTEEKETLSKHKQSEHGNRKHVCPHCGLELSTKKSLDKHIQEKHVAAENKCSQCDKIFKNNNLLQQHHCEHRHDGQDALKCNQCDSKFNNKHPLDPHKRREHRETSYTCDQCMFKIDKKGLKDSHQQKKHRCVADFDVFNVTNRGKDNKELPSTTTETTETDGPDPKIHQMKVNLTQNQEHI